MSKRKADKDEAQQPEGASPKKKSKIAKEDQTKPPEDDSAEKKQKPGKGKKQKKDGKAAKEEGGGEFLAAVKKGDPKFLKSNKGNIEKLSGEELDTILKYFAEQDNVDALRALADFGSDIMNDAIDRNFFEMCHSVAAKGQLEVFDFLTEYASAEQLEEVVFNLDFSALPLISEIVERAGLEDETDAMRARMQVNAFKDKERPSHLSPLVNKALDIMTEASEMDSEGDKASGTRADRYLKAQRKIADAIIQASTEVAGKDTKAEKAASQSSSGSDKEKEKRVRFVLPTMIIAAGGDSQSLSQSQNEELIAKAAAEAKRGLETKQHKAESVKFFQTVIAGDPAFLEGNKKRIKEFSPGQFRVAIQSCKVPTSADALKKMRNEVFHAAAEDGDADKVSDFLKIPRDIKTRSSKARMDAFKREHLEIVKFNQNVAVSMVSKGHLEIFDLILLRTPFSADWFAKNVNFDKLPVIGDLVKKTRWKTEKVLKVRVIMSELQDELFRDLAYDRDTRNSPERLGEDTSEQRLTKKLQELQSSPTIDKSLFPLAAQCLQIMWKAEKKEKKEKDSASDSEGMETDLKDQHDRIARAKKYQSDQMRMNVHIAEADQILEASGRMSAGITMVSGAPGFGFDPESGKPGKSPGSSSSKQLAGSKGQGKKGAR